MMCIIYHRYRFNGSYDDIYTLLENGRQLVEEDHDTRFCFNTCRDKKFIDIFISELKHVRQLDMLVRKTIYPAELGNRGLRFLYNVFSKRFGFDGIIKDATTSEFLYLSLGSSWYFLNTETLEFKKLHYSCIGRRMPLWNHSAMYLGNVIPKRYVRFLVYRTHMNGPSLPIEVRKRMFPNKEKVTAQDIYSKAQQWAFANNHFIRCVGKVYSMYSDVRWYDIVYPPDVSCYLKKIIIYKDLKVPINFWTNNKTPIYETDRDSVKVLHTQGWWTYLEDERTIEGLKELKKLNYYQFPGIRNNKRIDRYADVFVFTE